MGEWVPPPTFQSGETVTAAFLTNFGRNLRELKDLDRVHCYHSQDEELKDSEWEVVRFDSDSADNSDMHGNHRTKQYGSPASSSKHGSRDGKWPDTSTKRSARVTARDDAAYLVIFKVNFAANTTGVRRVMLRKNSNEAPGSGHALGTWYGDAPSVAVTVAGEVMVQMERGDHVNLFVWQNSGGLLEMNSGIDTTFLQVAQLTG